MRVGLVFAVWVQAACGGGGTGPQTLLSSGPEALLPTEPETPLSSVREHMIWYQPKGTVGALESAWIRETGEDSYEVVATRPEVVVVDGSSLWALRSSDTPGTPC